MRVNARTAQCSVRRPHLSDMYTMLCMAMFADCWNKQGGSQAAEGVTQDSCEWMHTRTSTATTAAATAPSAPHARPQHHNTVDSSQQTLSSYEKPSSSDTEATLSPGFSGTCTCSDSESGRPSKSGSASCTCGGGGKKEVVEVVVIVSRGEKKFEARAPRARRRRGHISVYEHCLTHALCPNVYVCACVCLCASVSICLSVCAQP